MRSELRSQRRRPVLQECLGSRVCSEERRGEKSTERAHGQDETTLALCHSGCDEAGHLERAEAVDGYDVAHLLVRREKERDGVCVALSNVVDENSDVEVVNEGLQLGIVRRVVFGKVHSEVFRLDEWRLRLNLLGEGGELGFGARDEEDVETLRGELEGVFLAEPVGRARDDCPGSLGAILAQLQIC